MSAMTQLSLPTFSSASGLEPLKRAIAHAESSPGARVWARDVSAEGHKEYIVATRAVFLPMYLLLQAAQRVYYEIIPSNVPVKLYLDMDHHLPGDPAVSEADLDEALAAFVREMCRVYQGVIDDSQVKESIILTSSVPGVKLSRHVRFPMLVLRSTADAQALVKNVKEQLPPTQARFFDHAPYSRNQALRLPFSHKAGKDNCLVFRDISARTRDFGFKFSL